MTKFRSSTPTAASLLLALAATIAVAQTAPVKPAAKAGATPAGKTLSGKAAGGGKLMTRDELRSCLKRLDDVNQGSKEVEALRPALDRERDELKASGESLKAELAELQRKQAAVREWEDRARAHAVEIESFNTRSAAVQQVPRNQQDKLLEELKGERERLQKTRELLAADEAALVPVYQSSARRYNEQAKARDAEVVDWNQRSAAAMQSTVTLQEARALWLDECANRAYLEDDEVAIKAGK